MNNKHTLFVQKSADSTKIKYIYLFILLVLHNLDPRTINITSVCCVDVFMKVTGFINPPF